MFYTTTTTTTKVNFLWQKLYYTCSGFIKITKWNPLFHQSRL